MKILIVGAGPAGLSLAYLLRRASSAIEVTVLERHGADDPIGWGITLPLDALRELDAEDPAHERADQAWIVFRGAQYLAAPQRLMTLSRHTLIQWLTKKAVAAGADVRFDATIATKADLDPTAYDLVVAADGVNSVVRSWYADALKPTRQPSELLHAWMSTPKIFDGIPSFFQETGGSLLVAWGYRYSRSASTFIVLGLPGVVSRLGLDQGSAGPLEGIFRDVLDGQPLVHHGALTWARFEDLGMKSTFVDNVVLIGDAAHTAHFSRGYGTLLALGDSYELARRLTGAANVRAALEQYQAVRTIEVRRHQNMALSSHNWYARITRRYEDGDREAVPTAIAEVERLTRG